MLRVIVSLLPALTLSLVVLGGVVHSTGSSLACPDWPTCFGSFAPAMVGGVLFEHSHRLLAALVATLTLLVAVLAFKTRPPGHALRRASVAAVALVLVQAVLGGLTVIYQLPAAVSTAHLAAAMLFLCLTLWLAWLVSQGSGGASARSSLLRPACLALGACYMQILLGGVVRHTGSSFSCLELPGCGPGFWPAASDTLGQLHMLHRAGALVVLLLVLHVAVLAERARNRSPFVRWLTRGACALLFLQVALGWASVAHGLNAALVSLHLGVGALMLAHLFVLVLVTANRGGEASFDGAYLESH